MAAQMHLAPQAAHWAELPGEGGTEWLGQQEGATELPAPRQSRRLVAHSGVRSAAASEPLG